MRQRFGKSAWIFAAGALLCRAETAEIERPMDRYRPIVDRQPFGQPAPPADDSPPIAPETGPAPFRFSSLMETEGEVYAGLVDTQGQRALQLQPGQSEEGVTLLSVDVEKMEARIQKDGRVFSLQMESAPPSAAGPRPPPSAGHPAVAPGAIRPGAPDFAAQERMREMMERRRQILERMRQRREAATP